MRSPLILAAIPFFPALAGTAAAVLRFGRHDALGGIGCVLVGLALTVALALWLHRARARR